MPAHRIRWRFDLPEAEAPQQIAWWDWGHAGMKAALPDIRALDIHAFIERYR